LTSFALLLTAGASLAQAQAPVISPGGVQNAASSDTTGLPLALGSLISIKGTNLSAVTDVDTVIPLPPTMDGVRVTVNNVAAPLLYVSGGQINAQIPWEALASGPPTTNTTAQLVVSTAAGGASMPANVTLGPAGPGIFTVDSTGSGQAWAYSNIDNAVASATPVPPYTSHPAKINDPYSLVILATGLGAVTPAEVTGAGLPSGVISNTVTTPTVLIGNVPAQVLFSGLTPQYPGVYQLNVIVATGTPPGNAVPLQIRMNGVTSRNDVTIAVSQ
jgi:uncharacterized protein (TIGR03437 family)